MPFELQRMVFSEILREYAWFFDDGEIEKFLSFLETLVFKEDDFDDIEISDKPKRSDMVFVYNNFESKSIKFL